MHKYSVLEVDVKGVQTPAVKFEGDPYNNMVVSYGRVRLIENEDDTLTVSFEYTIHSEPLETYTTEEMITFLGDFLTALMLDKLAAQEVLYTGGIDGKNDFDEFDSFREISA